MALPLPKLTGPTVAAIGGTVLPSGASTTDETILAPAINRLIDELNALGVRVATLESAPTPTSIVIEITAEQEAALDAVPLGGLFVLAGPTKEFPAERP